MNPTYKVKCTDKSGSPLPYPAQLIPHEQALEILDREHDRQRLYALEVGGPAMVDSDGDEWLRVS